MSIQYAMTSLNSSNEICILCRGRFTINDFYVYKFSLLTNLLSIYSLPFNGYYNTIISTDQNILATNEFELNQELKVIKAYNLLGQVIDKETKNQIIIVEYESGSRKKVFQVSNVN